jgi:hypothetical protein
MGSTWFREYVRRANLRQWVSDGLNAYGVVVKVLAACERETNRRRLNERRNAP